MATVTAPTNEEFAQAVGVDFTTVSKYRNGHRRPSVAVLGRISTAYAIPLEDLVRAHGKGAAAFGRLLRRRVFHGSRS